MRPHLAIYADGELAAELRPAVEAHLAECQKCRVQVERWQALRGCVRRAVVSEALPAGLEQRLRHRLRDQSWTARRRLIKFVVPGLATAAVIVVAVLLYLPGGGGGSVALAAVDVSAEDFARVYRKCAVAKHHDSHNCRGMSAQDARELLARELGFKPLVADLSAHGYMLEGACKCFPVHDLRVIHVHYRSQDTQAQVVSLFSADRCVRLKAGSPFRGEGDRGRPDRSYEVAKSGQVNVLKWDEQRGSFALCSQMEQEKLLELAGSVDFARFLRQLPIYARISDR
ncbi:MAG TPA: zf-HC2 domain-containing protein [Phycisphaerae bacterium]|nr:zf-HC2 domain-containing protein [Phycisphaerae bacterium]